jgi:2-oxoglutarate/2-oxoacid ferredoxin oxidoreductase subunit beta
MDELATYAENNWCPGCGNFAILAALKDAVPRLEAEGVPRSKLMVVTGIGQHGKIFDYINLSGLYALHGRAVATAQGMKLANPDAKVIAFVGDGDTLGEGLEHVLFAAKRNADISVVVHDNGVYALTTGQYAPTSARGYRGPSTPAGSVEDPLQPLALLLQAGATFVGRGFSGQREHLADLLVRAVLHPGFSFVDVLQPCVTFNNTWQLYNGLVEPLSEPAATYDEAMQLARRSDHLPIGVIYRTDREPFQQALYGGWNPVRDHRSREERLESVARLLQVQRRLPDTPAINPRDAFEFAKHERQ